MNRRSFEALSADLPAGPWCGSETLDAALPEGGFLTAAYLTTSDDRVWLTAIGQ